MAPSFFSERPSRDFENLNERRQKLLNTARRDGAANNPGAYCKHLIEPVPRFVQAECEEVVNTNAQDRNAWIVVGRDRHGSTASGYGGVGATQAGMIDLVVGRGGAEPADDDYLDPAFVNGDCARIYISQKCDLDKYFGLAQGLKIGNPRTRSGVGIKADGVRIIGLEGIKLVTGGRTDVNSKGLDIDVISGIELIAGNVSEEESQPLVKGENLILYLKALQANIDQLNGAVDQICRTLRSQAAALAGHVHVSVFPAGPTTMGTHLGNSIRVSIDASLTETVVWFNKINQFMDENQFLEPYGPKYILSKFNTTN